MANELMVNALLDKLKTQELMLAEFYELLIEKCPEHETTWTYLVKQEKMHAQALEMLKEKFADDTVFMNSELIQYKTINYSTEFIMTNTSEIKNQEHSTEDMLETALQLESNTIESITFESMSSNLEPMNKVLRKLQADSENHRQLIKDAIETQKSQTSGLLNRIKAKFSKE